MEVPDAGQVTGWIGVDRGQNNIAVAALPNGFGRFWKAGRVKSLRRRFQKLRKELQEAQKTRKVKQLERRERRMMTHINHVISKELVQLRKRRLKVQSMLPSICQQCPIVPEARRF
jgi:ABC-type phosphate transport system auxiliary subunit